MYGGMILMHNSHFQYTGMTKPEIYLHDAKI